MIYTDSCRSPLGSMLLACDEEGLTGLWFTEGSRYFASRLIPVEALPSCIRKYNAW